MDDVQIGRALRALRLKRGWRQHDVSARSGVSQTAISLIEAGRFDHMSLDRLRCVARVLDAQLSLTVRWRGGELDRLLDEGHAALGAAVTEWLGRRGWSVQPEVTFSVYGERGSIDLLAWHDATRTVLVIELKTMLASVEETLRRHDVKTRLASEVAPESTGWRPSTVARLLVLPNHPTARRRVARTDVLLRPAYPLRTTAVRDWVRTPAGGVSGLVFVALPPRAGGLRRQRIRLPTAAVQGAGAVADRVDRAGGDPVDRAAASGGPRARRGHGRGLGERVAPAQESWRP